jgi:hypothetical protein
MFLINKTFIRIMDECFILLLNYYGLKKLSIILIN